MATWNGSYRADASAAVTREIAHGVEEHTSSPVTRTRSVRLRAVIAEQRDTQLEATAFAWRPQWPSWLSTALELNYLAVTTRDTRPALVIQWSILEIIADEHEPATILLSSLAPNARKGLLRTVRDAAVVVLSRPSVERLLARLHDAQAESIAARIQKALRRYDIDVAASDIDRVRKARGTIAHGGAADHAYQEAERQVRTWVQAVLRAALAGRDQTSSGC